MPNEINPDWSQYWFRFQDRDTPGSTMLHSEFVSNISAEDDVIDIGCGYGRVAFDMAKQTGCKVVGVDINEKEIQAAKRDGKSQGHRLDFRVMNAIDLDFADRTFDIALLLGVLGAVQQGLRQRIIKEAVRVLKPGGQLYIGEFARSDASHRQNRYIRDQKTTGELGSNVVRRNNEVLFIAKHFLPEELKTLLKQAGLEDITIREDVIKIKGIRNPDRNFTKHHLSVWGRK